MICGNDCWSQSLSPWSAPLWFYWLTIPWPVRLRSRDPQTHRGHETARRRGPRRGDSITSIRQEWVPLERISPRLQRAVIVAEDGRFRDHDGIDWNALREEFRYGGDDDFSILDADDRRALLESLRYYRENRDKVRGRSTITQQLAKNLYYSTDRSVVRKLEEFVVARGSSSSSQGPHPRDLPERRRVGPGIFGAEAAARHYFGRSAADLTADQAAALAATLPHPLTSNPRTAAGPHAVAQAAHPVAHGRLRRGGDRTARARVAPDAEERAPLGAAVDTAGPDSARDTARPTPPDHRRRSRRPGRHPPTRLPAVPPPDTSSMRRGSRAASAGRRPHTDRTASRKPRKMRRRDRRRRRPPRCVRVPLHAQQPRVVSCSIASTRPSSARAVTTRRSSPSRLDRLVVERVDVQPVRADEAAQHRVRPDRGAWERLSHGSACWCSSSLGRSVAMSW
jgi:monofunctional glycosyltransferase